MRRVDRPRSGLRCVFGAHDAVDAVVVDATLHGSAGEQVLCKTPTDSMNIATGNVGPWCSQHGNATHCRDPAYAASALTALEIRVTLNANATDASPTALVFMLLPPHLPALYNLEPWGGPPLGGTRVQIVGEELLSLSNRAQPLCRFGHLQVPATVGGRGGSPALLSAPLHTRVALHDARSTRTVSVEAGHLVTCDSPPGHSFGSRWVRVSVSLNGEHFSEDSLAFRYTAFAVEGVFPTGAPLAGGTRVVVRGQGLADFGGMSCVFGVDAVPATLIDSRSVRCDSPVVEDAGAVALRFMMPRRT